MEIERKEVLGIDVSKDTLDYYERKGDKSKRVFNNLSGYEAIKKVVTSRSIDLVVFESTGGYEQGLSEYLEESGITFSRVDGLKVRYFAKSEGKFAKTDSIDAKLLCKYGESKDLKPTVLYSKERREMSELLRRRNQLLRMQTMEKNRRGRPYGVRFCLDSIKTLLGSIQTEIKAVERKVIELISECSELKKNYELLQTMNGIGPVVAATLVICVPELGSIDRNKLGALIGVSPYDNESGTKTGDRSIYGGRKSVRNTLYMGALSAAHSNMVICSYYKKLLSKGKPKKVALVACMRKMLITANAMVRDSLEWSDIRFVTQKQDMVKS